MKLLSSSKTFSGTQSFYEHYSESTTSPMRFSVFIPPTKSKVLVPSLIWLSGLTCTEENFTVKAGAQRMAAKLGLMLIAPDTSPRHLQLPGEADHYDFGQGASFYLDATQEPWKKHYQMYTYLTQEFPQFLATHFPMDDERLGIFGHSMGGHGALSMAIKNPKLFRSVSAFAPITSLKSSPWGKKALLGYLGNDEALWDEYDATSLVKKFKWPGPALLIDQGSEDQFMEEQLKPKLFQSACMQVGVPLNLRIQDGYDHSYFFIASFIEDHLRYHHQNLR